MTTATEEYNGHPSYDHWNVALWVGNDESLYNIALESDSPEDFASWCSESYPKTADGVTATPELAAYAWESVREDGAYDRLDNCEME